MKAKLTDYIFVDEFQLQKYIEQIPASSSKERKLSWKFSLSLTGPALETGQEISNRPSNNHEKIQRLIEFLRKNDLLCDSRPHSDREYDNGKPFILETFMARKVIIPKQHLTSINGLNGFAVWVSDPDIEQLSGKDLQDLFFHATYLYLTEAYWDDKPPQTGLSSFSALQFLAHQITGKPVTIERENSRTWGYMNRDHPSIKLQRIGGIATDTRRVTSLYRKRYLSDEQSFVVGMQQHRIHDLVGYPVFIASAF